MILVDANLLIYAGVKGMSQHRAALGWLDRSLSEGPSLGLPWESVLAFVRIVTNSRAFENPLRTREAWEMVRRWLDHRTVWVPLPTERHADVLERLLMVHGVRANLAMDAHLAALAIEHGLTLCTTDGDFARFPDLRWENPLSCIG